MRLALLFLVACGSVSSQQPTIDAAPEIDAPSCGPTDQVDSCGATCEKCTATGARTMPACDGTACQVACIGNAPKCNDNSCSKAVFDFEDGTTQGLTMTGVSLSVAPHGGSMALAIPTTSLNPTIFLNVPVCLSGAIDLSKLTLSATIFYDDPTADTGFQYITQAWTPVKAAGMANFIGFIQIEANKPQAFSAPISAATSSTSTPTIQFEIGTLGSVFSGTVWFDDIKVQ
jgi:hypothetical protein